MYTVNYQTILANQESLVHLPVFTGEHNQPIEEPLHVDDLAYGMLQVASDLMYQYIIKPNPRLLENISTICRFFVKEGLSVVDVELIMDAYKISLEKHNSVPLLVSPMTHFLLEHGYNGVKHDKDSDLNMRFPWNTVVREGLEEF